MFNKDMEYVGAVFKTEKRKTYPDGTVEIKKTYGFEPSEEGGKKGAKAGAATGAAIGGIIGGGGGALIGGAIGAAIGGIGGFIFGEDKKENEKEIKEIKISPEDEKKIGELFKNSK